MCVGPHQMLLMRLSEDVDEDFLDDVSDDEGCVS